MLAQLRDRVALSLQLLSLPQRGHDLLRRIPLPRGARARRNSPRYARASELRDDPEIDCSNATSLTFPSCQAPKGARGVLTILALKDGHVTRLFLGPAD
jgi:hypothetical protein